jgi:glutaconate CoA-transferase subunit B
MEQVMEGYTRDELLAVLVSREIEDGFIVSAGAGQEVIRAGILLAHYDHGPNIEFWTSMGRLNLCDEPSSGVFDSAVDWRGIKGAEGYLVFDQLPSYFKLYTKRRIAFLGAIQIDQYGNANLIGVGQDHNHLAFRGPGAVGSCGIGTYCKHFYLYTGSHTKILFVDKCDYISCYGWGEGGPEARTRLGLPGGGPKYCITPLCVMDFDPLSKRLKLKSIHQGVSVSEVLDKTGFDLTVPEQLLVTEAPSDRELDILRNKVDITGRLRGRK